MRKHLLNYDIQYFADEVEGAEVQETADPVEEETSEAEVETGETEETEAPQPQQSDEDNARYAAIRRRAEEDARRKYQGQMEALNQRAAALCQGIPNPATNQPIRTMEEYLDALQYQQRQAAEVEMQEKGIDPSMIDRMIATNPVVMQAQQVLEATQMNDANMRLQNDIAEICKYDPSMKGLEDIATLPYFPDMLDMVQKSGGQVSLLDAYKVYGFDSYMQHQTDAGRQQAINQMRGKSHLPSQGKGVDQADDYVEVPADIMSRWKADGKTEKQIRDLYKKVAGKLHLN